METSNRLVSGGEKMNRYKKLEEINTELSDSCSVYNAQLYENQETGIAYITAWISFHPEDDKNKIEVAIEKLKTSGFNNGDGFSFDRADGEHFTFLQFLFY